MSTARLGGQNGHSPLLTAAGAVGVSTAPTIRADGCVQLWSGRLKEDNPIEVGVGQAEDPAARSYPPTARPGQPVYNDRRLCHGLSLQRIGGHSMLSSVSCRQCRHGMRPSSRMARILG